MVGGERVDFGIMPQYHSLLPLLWEQPYISRPLVIEDWVCTGSPYGDQPWQPPKSVESGYERCFHLGYKMHPGIHRPATISLMDFVAEQQGIALRDPVPFISVPRRFDRKMGKIITHAFNQEFSELKEEFLRLLKLGLPEMVFVDVGKFNWLVSADFIANSGYFVGCRSANNVVAHGVGQRNIFIYEPNSSRHADGFLGTTFGCPYGQAEVTAPLEARPDAAAALAVQTITKWREQFELQETTS